MAAPGEALRVLLEIVRAYKEERTREDTSHAETR